MATEERETSLNLPASGMADFLQEVRSDLCLITGAGGTSYEDLGLSLEDVRQPYLVIGKPGIGKTEGIQGIIAELNAILPPDKQLGFKKIQLGQTTVGELSGVPVAYNGDIIRSILPDLPVEERDGKYGVLFFDEITSADTAQIQPALGLCDGSRSNGVYKVPDHWLVVAAGNGPDCTNFVELHDVTISRFTGGAYRIAFDYNRDWKKWAYAHNINEDIIAFLNFDNTACLRIESTDLDEAGRLFPCPRTWTGLSRLLKKRELTGRKVQQYEIADVAGRVVGMRVGNELSAFLAFKETLSYDADKILAGTEVKPAVGLQKESYHIILEAVIKKMRALAEDSSVQNKQYPEDTYKKCANAVKWFLSFPELENACNALVEMKDNVPSLNSILFAPTFSMLCPELKEFFKTHQALFATHQSAIKNMRV